MNKNTKIIGGYDTIRGGYQPTQLAKNRTPPKGGSGVASKHPKWRLDESLSLKAMKKNLTGRTGVTIDLSKISMSPSGNIQPSDNSC